jgi:hypothetical protein
MQRRYVWSSENWFGLNSRLKKHDKVSFCVYDDGYRNEGNRFFYVLMNAG